MNEGTEAQRLVRVLAFALRHHPLRFGVALDDEGFADLDELAVGIRYSDYEWACVGRDQIVSAVRDTAPDRFEVRGGLVRARYGHSVALGSPGVRRTPPAVLLHGTTAEAAGAVRSSGLRPMGRALVHLTSDPDYATQVAAAKGGGVVLTVHAGTAAEAGVEFFQANAHVWLAREVAAEFIGPAGTPAGGGGGLIPLRFGRYEGKAGAVHEKGSEESDGSADEMGSTQ